MTDLPCTLIRSRRKTLAIQITPAGEILLRCPHRLSAAQARKFLEEKRPWIEAQLAKIAARPALPPLTPEEQNALVNQARTDLPQRAARFAPLIGVTYGSVTVRSQRTRWGSCSARGNLSFNCLLMLAPPEVRDYVVVHELCHRKEMNHSPAFWALVGSILPDFRQQKAWLKTQGPALIARLEP